MPNEETAKSSRRKSDEPKRLRTGGAEDRLEVLLGPVPLKRKGASRRV